MAADIRIYGELTAEFDGVLTRLEAAGSSLSWHLVDATRIFPGLVADQATLVALADRLAHIGLTLQLRDRRGRLLDAGAIRRSPFGRILLGSARLRPRGLLRWPGLARRLPHGSW